MIQHALFSVENLEGVRCTENRNKLNIVDPQLSPPHVTYLLFRSIVNGSAIDNRASDRSLFIKFALRLPQNIFFSAQNTSLPSVVNDTITPTTPT